MSLFDLNRRFIASGLSRRAIPNHRDFSGGIGSGGGGSSGLLDFSALTVVRTAGGDWTDPRDAVVYPDPGSNLPRLASDGALYVDSGRHTYAAGTYNALMRTGPFVLQFTPEWATGGAVGQATMLSWRSGGDTYDLEWVGSLGRLRFQDAGAAPVAQLTGVSFSAGQTLTVECNPAAGSITLSGATTGNGTATGTGVALDSSYALEVGTSQQFSAALMQGIIESPLPV
jgi:hypothetical protein